MPMLNVFDTDAFGVVQLTDAINKIKFVPGRIGALGLFAEQGVATTSIAVEEKNGVLSLIAPSARGGPGTTLDKSKRSLLDIRVPHFEINDSIMAEEVQGVRAWGSETDVEMVMGKIADRGAIHSQSLEATQEYSRIGAVKGIVTYADASTLNLFTTFGVQAQTEVDFALDTANPAAGVVRKTCTQVERTIATALGGIPYLGLHAFCGDAFWDDLVAHSEVRESYKYQEGAALRSGVAFGSFAFGNITWENYRGAVGPTAFVHTDKCHIFPVGVPGMFVTRYAPADYMETVNTIGQRLYQKQYVMPNGKGVNLDTQMNALNICTIPRALVQGKRT